MKKYDFFLSHRSIPTQKELARVIYYNAISNNISIWYDEDKLSYGDDLNESMKRGIENSNGFLLLHSKEAKASANVLFEMDIARKKYEIDPSFKLFVLKLDTEPLDEFWTKFLYIDLRDKNIYSSVISILEGISGKKIIAPIQAMSILSDTPSFVFDNESKTTIEHSRNFMLYYFGLIKQLLNGVVSVADFMPHAQNEHHDTLKKLLSLSLIEQIPNIQGGIIPIGKGEIEIIHSNRMRVAPKLNIILPDKYYYEVVTNNEIFTRIKFYESTTNKIVYHAIPFSIEMDAEL